MLTLTSFRTENKEDFVEQELTQEEKRELRRQNATRMREEYL